MKLGTITQDGNADVYSYDEDDMVLDPCLVQHLAVSLVSCCIDVGHVVKFGLDPKLFLCVFK